MKVIVTSWVFPHESGSDQWWDQRPKSIERISTTADDLKKFLTENCEMCGKNILFKKGFMHMQVIGTPHEVFFKDEITERYDGDGFRYLQDLLDNDTLGNCVAKQWNEGHEDGATYYLFQVRNLH